MTLRTLFRQLEERLLSEDMRLHDDCWDWVQFFKGQAGRTR